MVEKGILMNIYSKFIAKLLLLIKTKEFLRKISRSLGILILNIPARVAHREIKKNCEHSFVPRNSFNFILQICIKAPMNVSIKTN